MEEENVVCTQVPLAPECQVNICLSNIAADKLDGVVENKNNAGHGPKNAQHSDFIKCLSCQDLTSKSIFQHAEKVIEYMNQKRQELSMKIEERKLDRERVIGRLEDLRYMYRSLKYDAAYQKQNLEPLQVALDKLSFKNNAYHYTAIKSCLIADEIHFNDLRFLLLHGSKSLAEEKRLLRETKKSQQKEANGSFSTLEELNRSISSLSCGSNCYFRDVIQRQKVLEEINQLKCTRETLIANAAVKGKIWNTLEPKETIKEKINLAGKKSQELREKCLAVRARIKHVNKNLETIEKDITSMRKQMIAANQKKSRAYKCIVGLRKQQDDQIVQSATSNPYD